VKDDPMMVKFLLVAVGSVRSWSRRRAKRKAMWLATDQLSRSPDDVLDDIGISRDEITCASQSKFLP
jgi:uncharacterized protein YjiS (DUF1127 family)